MKIPLWKGWSPSMGYDKRIAWTKNGVKRPYRGIGIDPMFGRQKRMRKASIEVMRLDFSAEDMKDILDNARRGQSFQKWEVTESAGTEDYWRHMEGEIRVQRLSQRTGRTSWNWRQRSKTWPNHLFDCEVMQFAAALLRKLIRSRDEKKTDD
jgi:hypothetical protein